MTTPKPRVQGEFEETVVRDWGGAVVRLLTGTLWRVSCPCRPTALSVSWSWDEAIEAALYHGRIYHS